ncbi:MAG: fatty acid CoA ligase family protein [Desulfobacterium sp.]|jgi:acyl-coenzyme A synthetase/AMP-(fatty) acid ligase|nr:fatty acid CoA ligase family protein [Desulfobacterium sp.]
MNDRVNISSWLKQSTARHPYKRAVVYPESRDGKGRVLYGHLTFLQLEQESDQLAFGLEQRGITRGIRTILMVPPGMEFFTLIFAMFKVGAIPVVVDPGMGIDRMLSCFEQGKPEAFIGIEKAHVLRILKPQVFKTLKIWVTVGRRWFWGGPTLDQLMIKGDDPFPVAETTANETAAILFTTGSTGPAKGVVYTHGNFNAQLIQIRDHFKIGPDEIDLPTFPLFALFDPALGMTAVIPDMDPTKPAFVNPERIIEAIFNQGVTNMFASPALLNRVGEYGRANSVKLPSLKRVISAGAPVTPANLEQFSFMLEPPAQIHTPYGATESVPILSIESDEILNETRSLSEQGFGICIGRPICGTEVAVIGLSDDPIEHFSDDLIVNDTEVGEIIVKARLVTRNYYNNPEADILAKIMDDRGFWHRMGDLGWKDSKGRIWFCGRKNHRVVMGKDTLFTIPCEAIFNNHESVQRSALVGVGPRQMQTPVIIIEPVKGIKNRKKLIQELEDLAVSHPLTEGIKHILIHPSFPVDIRHNAKIFREKLAVWAAEKLEF